MNATIDVVEKVVVYRPCAGGGVNYCEVQIKWVEKSNKWEPLHHVPRYLIFAY